MRYLVMFIGLVVSLGMLVVSGWMNFQFGHILGRSETEGDLLGLASVCADGFKMILPFLIFQSFREKHPTRGLAALAMWLVFTGYSVTSSLGFAAIKRSEFSGTRQMVAEKYQLLKGDLARQVTARQHIAAHRPAAAVKAAMAAQRQHRRWTSTSGCTDATAIRSRSFCSDYHQLGEELALARSAQRIDVKISALREELKSFDGAAVNGGPDPQVTVLAQISNLGEDKVRLGLILLVSLFVELGSGLGLFVTFGRIDRRQPRAIPPASEPQQVQPAPPLEVLVATQELLPPPPNGNEGWALQRLIKDPDAFSYLRDLYSDYQVSCQHKGQEALSFESFRRWLEREGFDDIAKRGNRLIIVGLRLKSEARTISMMH